MKHVVHGNKFLLSSETRFNSEDTMAFFESLGVPLKIERGNRVFPVSDKSSDIISALASELKKQKVQLEFGKVVTGIYTSNGAVAGVELDGEKIPYDAVVVATGGKSYEATGSTGDGYNFALSTGHNIIKPVPSLVGVCVSDLDIFALQGLSLKNVVVSAFKKDKCLYKSEIGEMLFTDFGVSGPIVLSLSAFVNREEPTDLKLYIDLKPAISQKELEDRITRDINVLGAKQVGTLLEGLLPKSMCEIVSNRLGLMLADKANQLTKENRERLAYLLKNFDLSVTAFEGFNRAVITSGGVDLKQVSPKDMQSKLIKNLYFIGEVLDVDALTGGFNLQIAFSTAAACASNIY